MVTYFVFLRAVNVNGKNSIKMAKLKQCLIDNAYLKVQTFIQSGNIILQSPDQPEDIKSRISMLIKEYFELDSMVFVRSLAQLKALVQAFPYHTYPGNKTFLTFLSDIPSRAHCEALASATIGEALYEIQQDNLASYLPEGMGTAILTNSFIEKKLQLTATGRNLNTIQKLIALAD